MCDSILLLTLLKCVALCEEKAKEIAKNIVYLRIYLEGSSVVKDLYTFVHLNLFCSLCGVVV